MEELLKNLFTPEYKPYTLSKLKELLSLKDTKELTLALKRLELDGKVFYDEQKHTYYTFPSNFYVAKVIKKESDGTTVEYNNNQIKLQDINIDIKKRIIINTANMKVIKVLNTIDYSNNEFLDKVYNIINPLNKGKTIKNIINELNIKEDTIKSELLNLEEKSIIYYDEYTDKYYLFPKNYVVTEVLTTKKGQLYVFDHKYIDIPGILPFDTVILDVKANNYKLVKILKRHNSNIVCEVTNNGIKVVGNNNISVRLPKHILKSFVPGERILVEILTTNFNGIYDCKFIKRMGFKDDLDAELTAIAYNNGFVTEYSKEELDQVDATPREVTKDEMEGKVDLTNECIFTIDGIHTKDFDDAVGIKLRNDGTYELLVSIAHVAHYIPFNSPLWNRASINTTSLYMIDSVSHMLHPTISNGICSLNPNVERLAKTFRIVVNDNGEVEDFEILDSVIKSKKRMTYEDVNKILEEGKMIDGYQEFVEDLELMQELSNILSNKRTKNGALDFDSKEIRFKLDDEKNIEGIEVVTQKTAEKIIENFMVLTNECVADYMLSLGLNFVYRNHETPFNDKVLETAHLLKSIGNHIDKIKDTTDPHVIQKIIASISNKEEFMVLSTLLLRSMKKAYYSSENKGHFALALSGYSQSTSPIRRYLDLLIQYILDNIEMFYDPEFDNDEFKKYIDNACKHATIMEKAEEKCEYEANKLFMLEYCIKNKSQEYIAYIQDISPQYIVVKTSELIEGIIYLSDLNDGTFKYDEEKKRLVNNMGEIINIGTKLNVTLNDYNKEFRLIYFRGNTINELKRVRK